MNDSATVVDQYPASIIHVHPLDLVEQRLESLPERVTVIEWKDR